MLSKIPFNAATYGPLTPKSVVSVTMPDPGRMFPSRLGSPVRSHDPDGLYRREILLPLIKGGDPRGHPPARGELADHPDPPGLTRRDQVVEDRVDRVFVEDPPVAIVEQVELQALELDASRRRDVGDHDGPEVGLAGLGTDRRELRAGDLDLVLAVGELVREGFQRADHRASSSIRSKPIPADSPRPLPDLE